MLQFRFNPSFRNDNSSEEHTGQTETGDDEEHDGQPPGGHKKVEDLGGQEAGDPVGQLYQTSHASLGDWSGRQKDDNLTCS